MTWENKAEEILKVFVGGKKKITSLELKNILRAECPGEQIFQRDVGNFLRSAYKDGKIPGYLLTKVPTSNGFYFEYVFDINVSIGNIDQEEQIDDDFDTEVETVRIEPILGKPIEKQDEDKIKLALDCLRKDYEANTTPDDSKFTERFIGKLKSELDKPNLPEPKSEDDELIDVATVMARFGY